MAEREEIPGQHEESADAPDRDSKGPFPGGEEPAGSGRGHSTDGANMSDEAAAPADASRGA